MDDIRYDINGYIYKFTNVRLDGGIPYGYCKRLNKWAWLYQNGIFIDGEGAVKGLKLD